MKKIFLLLFVIFLMTGCGGEKPSENINGTKHAITLTVGIDEFAPYGFTDQNGNISGFDIDLAKEAGKRMGIEVNFKFIDWDKKENDLNSGNVDLIWNGLDITPERKENILYSKPYMDNRQILVVKRGNPPDIHSLSDLAGKVVATQAGSNSENYVNENEAFKKSFADFKTYPKINDGFGGLSSGEFDVLIIDETAARYDMTKNPDLFEAVEVTIGPVTELGIGFRKGNTELRDKVQTVFDEMIADGTAKKISERWFGVNLIKANSQQNACRRES